MSTTDLDAIRQSVLDRMERSDRLVKSAIMGAAVLELLMLVTAIVFIDWSNRLEKVVFVLFVLSYTMMGLGMFALGGHVSRVGSRVLAALDSTHAG
jgi:hypothetical protein